MSTWGLTTAITIRRVISSRGMRSLECTLATTTSRRSNMSSSWSSARSEEHTSELQSLMRISYAVFCLKKKNCTNWTIKTINDHNSQSNTTLIHIHTYKVTKQKSSELTTEN